MRRCVILDQAEWDALPEALAVILERRAREGPGRFTVVSTETGDVVADRLENWLCGTLALAFLEIGQGLREE